MCVCNSVTTTQTVAAAASSRAKTDIDIFENELRDAAAAYFAYTPRSVAEETTTRFCRGERVRACECAVSVCVSVRARTQTRVHPVKRPSIVVTAVAAQPAPAGAPRPVACDLRATSHHSQTNSTRLQSSAWSSASSAQQQRQQHTAARRWSLARRRWRCGGR